VFVRCYDVHYLRQGESYAISSVCMSLSSYCLSVCTITAKPILLRLCVMVGPTNRKNWLTFGDNRSRIHIPDHFSTSLAIAEYGKFRRFISISRTVTGRFLRLSEKWLTFDKMMNPLHFGSDPAYILIGIPDHFCLRFWPLPQFASHSVNNRPVKRLPLSPMLSPAAGGLLYCTACRLELWVMTPFL